MPEAAKAQTPYIRARQEWDERFGDQIKSKNNWRLAAFVSMGTTFFCVTGMVAIGYRSNTVPYVVALDDVGRAVPVIPAKQVAVKDVRLQEAVVARWITDLRTIVTDAVAQRRLVDEVYAQTGQNSPASATITEFYSKNSPFDLLTKQTVDASVESIVQQSPKTYEVAWTETTRDLGGEFVASHRYRAFVSVTTQEVTDAKQALVNPLGLYVTNLTWGEVVSTGGDAQTTKWRLEQMIWFAAMMMAAQATSGAAGATAAPQPAPALTAQQKQELSTYNFKGAGAALNAQTNQPAQKPSPLTPIPPLQVPPIASRNPSGQSSAGRRSGRQRLGGPSELEASPCRIERRRGERGGGFPSMGNRSRHAHAWRGRPGGLCLRTRNAGDGLRSAAGLRHRIAGGRASSEPTPNWRLPPLGNYSRDVRLRP